MRSASAPKCQFDIELPSPQSDSCLDHMNTILAHNVCNLVLSPERVDERFMESPEYACVYWIEHTCRIQDVDFIGDITERVEVFLFQHLLHWMESMSILKMTRDCIALLEKLLAWLAVRP